MASISSLGIGSGLDLNSLLDQLESAERQQLTPIVQQQKSYLAKISAFGRLENALASFQEAAAKLADAESFQAVKADISGESLAVSADEQAVVGSYDIEVTQMARRYSIASAGLADKTELLGAGSIDFTLGNGESFSVSMDTKDSSLEGIRDAINGADAGVTASIVNDGSGQPYRLVLSSSDTGTEAAITAVNFTGLGGQLSLDAATEVQARNAELTVNGIAIESRGNRVEGAIQGVVLNIDDTGSATLDISRDSEAVQKNVETFVSAYNALQKTLSELTGYNAEAGSAGMLLGNATVRGVETQLRNLMGEAVDGAGFSTLSDLGISLQPDGTLEVDEEALDDALANRLGDLAGFFAGAVDDSEGFASRVDAALTSLLGEGGALENATGGLESSVDGLEERYERTEARIEETIARYRSQFTQLDSLIAQMNSTSSYLTQQFEALSVQLDQ
ncbi:flagellar filament capping protein FliD [Microbulbifer magnicolonia]|uniref:flagellar filament capping protein FliD n=1 Tax=Microbulbifer magnicolonia TaxID=3109744 RepID=UPI002B41277A|nr:flagellar filament capping protein FliD [Microbulbifer sp. GG15]